MSQQGYLYEKHGSFHLRYYISVKGKRIRKSTNFCEVTEETPSTDSPRVQELASTFMQKINEADSEREHRCPICNNKCKRTITQRLAKRS